MREQEVGRRAAGRPAQLARARARTAGSAARRGRARASRPCAVAKSSRWRRSSVPVRLSMKSWSMQFLQHAVEALLGDPQDVEQFGDRQPRMAVDEMQHAVVRPAEAEVLQEPVGVADEVAIGEEEQLDQIDTSGARRESGAGSGARGRRWPRLPFIGPVRSLVMSAIVDIFQADCYSSRPLSDGNGAAKAHDNAPDCRGSSRRAPHGQEQTMSAIPFDQRDGWHLVRRRSSCRGRTPRSTC